jgi:hypothetical protein
MSTVKSYREENVPDVTSPRKKKRNRMFSTKRNPSVDNTHASSDPELLSPRVVSTMPSKLSGKEPSRTELINSSGSAIQFQGSRIERKHRPPSKSYPERLDPVVAPSKDDVAILARIATAAAINQECEIPADKLVKRKHIIKEIISSEISYSNDLALLLKVRHPFGFQRKSICKYNQIRT